MWKRLSSSSLDKDLWDTCVHNDPAGLITALSWYLDAIAPQWEGWVKEENGQYTAVLPLVKRKFVGRPVITQPLLTQQFGLFISNSLLPLHQQWQELLPLFLNSSEALEKYSFKSRDYKFLKNRLPLLEKTNWILLLHDSYHLLKTRFSTNRIREVRKAEKAQLRLQSGDYLWPQVYALYRENVLNRLNKNQQLSLVQIIPNLVAASLQRGFGHVFLISLPSGQEVAGAFFTLYKNRLTYLLPATSEAGRKIGASTYLLNQVCRQFAGSEIILDFEGSSIPGLAHFYRSFGAQPETYGLLQNHNLPIFFKILNFCKSMAFSK